MSWACPRCARRMPAAELLACTACCPSTALDVRGNEDVRTLIAPAVMEAALAGQGQCLRAASAGPAWGHISQVNARGRSDGWSCGYRAAQMLWHWATQRTPYSGVTRPVPKLEGVRWALSRAWALGWDPDGAAHFHSSALGQPAWVGAADMWALLKSQRLPAVLVDVHSMASPHLGAVLAARAGLQVLWAGTAQATQQHHTPAHAGIAEFCAYWFAQPHASPLILQHQGHARLVVGMAEPGVASEVDMASTANECPVDARPPAPGWTSCRELELPTMSVERLRQVQLVVLDPGHAPAQVQAALGGTGTARVLLVPLASLRAATYQLLGLAGPASASSTPGGGGHVRTVHLLPRAVQPIEEL